MNSVEIFQKLERQLIESHPESYKIAKKLAESIVDSRTADAETIWSVIWDKPLYANTRDCTAKSWIEKITPYVENDLWKQWGLSEKNGIFIEKIEKGTSNDSFSLITPLAKEVRQETNISLNRLFIIQNAAIFLRKRSELNQETPFSDLSGEQDFNELLISLEKEFGAGWGYITTCHFLTDLGLACKPDLHLTRSVRYLGLLSDGETKGKKVPERKEIVLINQRVKDLVKEIYGDFTPEKLRYVDSILMKISQKGLLQAV